MGSIFSNCGGGSCIVEAVESWKDRRVCPAYAQLGNRKWVVTSSASTRGRAVA